MVGAGRVAGDYHWILWGFGFAEDEEDACTLTPGSLADALDLCRQGILYLHAISEETNTLGAAQPHMEEPGDG